MSLVKPRILFLALWAGLSCNEVQAGSCERWLRQEKIDPKGEKCWEKCVDVAGDILSKPWFSTCPGICGTFCQSSQNQQTIFDATFLYAGHLTQEERKLFAKFPKAGMIVFRNKTLAEAISGMQFGKSGLDDESDALRHFVWANQRPP